MRERPILFSGPMVRAILAGQKTQTRRIVKMQPRSRADIGHHGLGIPFIRNPDPLRKNVACPYGQPGDRLWVREAFRFAASLDCLSPSACADKCLDAGYNAPWAPTQYEADRQRTGNWRGFDTPPVVTEPGKLRPGIHMPRWASRITLEVTGVCVERLQDISDADAELEGVKCNMSQLGFRDHFQRLWESINGPGSWDANPWAWVVEFRRIEGE